MSVNEPIEAQHRLAALRNCHDELNMLRADVFRLRGLLNRQYRADAALYGMPHDCTADQHQVATTEHDAVHLLLMAEFETDSKPGTPEPVGLVFNSEGPSMNEDWVLVPREPTPEMVQAMAAAWQKAVDEDYPNECIAEYRAAIAAAPKLPVRILPSRL